MLTRLRATLFSARMPGLLALLLLIALGLTPGKSLAATHLMADTGNYQYLNDVYGAGAVQNSMVGPGNSASGQLYYMTYTYIGGTMDLVTVDPGTGTTTAYTSPAASEESAWGLTPGPDHNMYIGTLPNAHILKFDTAASQLIDLGQVPPDPHTGTQQTYIWAMTTSPHTHYVYACTYPSADIVTYDPLDPNPQMVNLGSMDPTGQEQYAHTCVADPNPKSPYIYIGLGSISNQMVAFNTDTHSVKLLLNIPTAGFGAVYNGWDGKIHATLMNGSTPQWYVLSNGKYTSTTKQMWYASSTTFKGGSYIVINQGQINIHYPKTVKTFPYTYQGKKLSIFRLGLGPDGQIYGGTTLPYDLFSYAPNNPSAGVTVKGQVGWGQPYSFLAYNNLLYIGAYSAPPLAVYNPTRPFDAQSNPLNVSGNLPTDLRSQAMTAAPNNYLYMGATAGYGQMTGPLVVMNTQNTSNIQQFFPVQNQGVATLITSSSTCQGSSASFCIIGGTSIYGGSGTTSQTISAQLFSWDPTTNAVVHTYSVPDVSNPNTITDLVTDPSTGYVYGIATSSDGCYLFVFNPSSGQFINGGTLLPLDRGATYNSATIYNGKFWGVSPDGIFSVDLSDLTQSTLYPSSVTITAGFALNGNTLYFASNSSLWSFTIS